MLIEHKLLYPQSDRVTCKLMADLIMISEMFVWVSMVTNAWTYIIEAKYQEIHIYVIVYIRS